MYINLFLAHCKLGVITLRMAPPIELSKSIPCLIHTYILEPKDDLNSDTSMESLKKLDLFYIVHENRIK